MAAASAVALALAGAAEACALVVGVALALVVGAALGSAAVVGSAELVIIMDREDGMAIIRTIIIPPVGGIIIGDGGIGGIVRCGGPSR